MGAYHHCSWNRSLYLVTFVIVLKCCPSLLLQSTPTENRHRNPSSSSLCNGNRFKFQQPVRLVSTSTSVSPSTTTSSSATQLALTTHALVANVSSPSPSPSNHLQHWYLISAIFMALAALGLVCLTPSLYIHPSTHSNAQLLSLSLLQQRQTSLATLWGSAASFGIVSFLFQWIPKLQQEQLQFSSCLDKQLHFGLLAFCTLGLVAIPGEFGMRLVVKNSLGSSPLRPNIVTQCISIAGLLVATMARITGFWTAFNGIQAAYKLTPPPLSTSPSTSAVQSEEILNSPNISEESSSILIHTKKNWFQRLWIVPKSYRKQSLFYRNAMLVLMTAAGSNLMEALFRWRYRSALAQQFSALDISLSISAGARLFFLTILMYALKVGSESLPILFLPTKSFKRNSPTNNQSQPVVEEGDSSNPQGLSSSQSLILTPTWTLSQRHLARSLSKVNLLVAIWALVVSLGQTAMRTRPVSMVAKPEMLLLAGLLAIKSYRLWLCQGQVQDA